MGAEFASGGAEEAGKERCGAEVIHNFAALVWWGQHGEAFGWRRAIGDEGTGENAAEGMRKPEGFSTFRFALDERTQLVDELGNGKACGWIGQVEGGESGGM